MSKHIESKETNSTFVNISMGLLAIVLIVGVVIKCAFHIFTQKYLNSKVLFDNPIQKDSVYLMRMSMNRFANSFFSYAIITFVIGFLALFIFMHRRKIKMSLSRLLWYLTIVSLLIIVAVMPFILVGKSEEYGILNYVHTILSLVPVTLIVLGIRFISNKYYSKQFK